MSQPRSCLLLAALVLTACEGRDDSTAPSTGTARVRIVNVSPTVSALDATRLDASLATGLAYGAVTPATGYGSSPAGPGDLTVRNGGVTIFNAQTPLRRDSATTILMLGSTDAAFAAGSARTFQPITLRDTAAVPASGAWLRIVHAADSVAVSTVTAGLATSGVDIYVYPQGTTRPTAAPVAGAALRLINATYRTVTAYLPLTAAGAYQVEVFVTGAAPATATPLISTVATLAAGSKATVIARRPLVGATAAPLNAFGLVLLSEQ